jgi:hypothetical protein
MCLTRDQTWVQYTPWITSPVIIMGKSLFFDQVQGFKNLVPECMPGQAKDPHRR